MNRACPYCTLDMPAAALRCPNCQGELRVCPRCHQKVGVTTRSKFVGLARGGTKTQARCMRCDKVLDGPRF